MSYFLNVRAKFVLTLFFLCVLPFVSPNWAAKTLTAPTLNAATAGDTQVSLRWTAVPQANNYTIKYGTSSGVFTKSVIAGNSTTFTVSGLSNGTKYYFVVTAKNAPDTSPNSNQLSATPQIPAPVLTSAVAGDGQVVLNWTSVPTATNYSVKYGTSWGNYGRTLPAADATSFTVTGLKNGTMYFFVVSASNTASISLNSAPKSAQPQISAPVLKKVTPGNMQATLSWDPVPQAQSYWVKWKTSSDRWAKAMNIGNLNAYTIRGLKNGTNYYFTVSAVSGPSTSLDSAGINATPSGWVPPSPKSMVTISANPQTITKGSSAILTWQSTDATTLYIDNVLGPVGTSGTVSVSPQTTTTYTITATGPLGSASAKVTVYVTSPPAALPEGSFGAQYSQTIPADATVSEYNIKRFAVIRGEVKNKSNEPLANVSVMVEGKPKYGTSKTDANGEFSLPVDINGTVTISFKKDGFITSHRQVTVSPNDVAITESVVLLTEDAKATEIILDGNANNVIVHQSTPVNDASGTRQANVVIAADNKIYAVTPSGADMFELSKFTMRATEFSTPESMPAVLPPTSAFTYCIEMKVDGVDNVRFKDPVIVYVDNFLGFDVGEIVPVGYYDRDRGVWVPSENGRVVKLLDTNSDGKVDALDSNNDGAPDDLNANGSYLDEVKGLNDPSKYAPGKTFWRVSLTHFTPWDLNWPMGPSADAIASNATGTPVADQQLKGCEDDAKPTDSYVSCRSRIYHEDIDIPGTDLTLHYASNRVPDYKTIITVPASGATVPPSLKRIDVRLNIAGRTFVQTLPTQANQTAEFSWDGLDYLGHRVDSATADIVIEFVYDAMYRGFGGSFASPAFAQPGVTPTLVVARSEVIFSKQQTLLIHNQAQTHEGLTQGWTLSNHHYMSAKDTSTLYKGNGDVLNNGSNIITTIAGTSSSTFPGDNGPATNALLQYLNDVVTDQNGNIYVIDFYRIRKIDVNGIITHFAGKYNAHWGYGGDGGPATAATMAPSGLAVDLNGNLYVAEGANHRIRKIDLSGIITTIAGTGSIGYSGDGGPAIAAMLYFPNDVAVDQNGNVYVADQGNHRIRKIDTNGIITTIAGTGSSACTGGEGGPATAARVCNPEAIAVDQNGNIYISGKEAGRIWKIDSSGIITIFAGPGYYGGDSGDGGLATAARVYPIAMTIDQSGNVYVVDALYNRIRKIDTYGNITTVAGTGGYGYSGDGGPSREAMFAKPNDITIDNSGNIYISDTDNGRIRKISPATALTSASPGDMTFAEEGLGYIFSFDGKHKQTVDLDTKKVLEQFSYDPSGRLISSTDSFGNNVTIERNAAGVPTAIVSPDGVRTNLTVDAGNHLTQITYPDGKSYKFEYTFGGLLTKETEPKGNFFTHTFDASGRITDVVDQAGGHEQFGRKVDVNTGDITTTVTSGEGDIVTYLDQTLPGGALTSTSSISGITKPATVTRSSDGLTSKITSPDLTVSDLNFALDPEYKFKYLQSQKITTPAGLTAQVSFNRTYTDTNSDDKKDLIARTVSLNSKTTTLTHNVLTSTISATSPLGRTITTLYDPTTLLTSNVSVPGLLDTTYTYDSKGRVSVVTTGTRNTSFAYDLSGNVQSMTDPRGNRTSYTYDAVGRTTSIQRPDLTSIRFAYDANGNMTVLTNPSSQNHGYIYNNVNLATSYAPPISASTQYVYDKERRLKEIIFPSGRQIKNIYTGVLLSQVQTPEGNIDYSYLPSGQLSSISKNSESLTLSYDGSLLKTLTSSGTLAQTLSLTYNNDLKVTGLTYSGAVNNFGYDNDGLLTSSGRFTISRNAQNGLPTSVTGGALNLGRTFDGYAQLTSQTQTVNSAAASSWTLTYNNNGQIATKSETVAGITSTYVYTYDSLGRLTKVEKGGIIVEEYQYAASGTRSYEINSLRGIAGRSLTYNAEDQLLSVGSATYQYDADGFLARKVDAGLTTTYDYSSRGELLKVSLPSAQIVEYVYDPLGRRIAKKINSVVVEKYLWAGLTQLLAVYDGSDNLLMRFEYSDSRTPNAMVKAGTTYYLSYDQVGSLRAVHDATGTLIKRIDYDSFGNIFTDTNPAFTLPFGFAGGLDDRDTRLVHFGFRDYDPAIGRWTAKDPIGFNGGDVDLYGYVESDPVNFVDPEGEQAVTEEILVGATVITLISYGLQYYYAHPLYWNFPDWQFPLLDLPQTNIMFCPFYAKEHTKGARPSTKNKHQEGEARKKKDQRGEEGDKRRDPRGKRPPGWKGPWPPPKKINETKINETGSQ